MLHTGGLDASLGLVDAGFDLSRQPNHSSASNLEAESDCKGAGEAHSIVNYPLDGD